MVSWTAPGDGGSQITSYTVTPFIGATPQAATTVSGTPPATSTTVAGLTNGTAYTFTVTATNSVATGPASAPSNSVTPSATTPTSPTIDSSTPAIKPFQNNVTSVVSDPFSPPAASVIYAVFSMDSFPAAASTVASIANTGSALTWHFKGNENHTNQTIGGFVEIWWTFNPQPQSNLTVQATLSQATKNVFPPVGALQLVVFDNAAPNQASAAWTPTWDIGGGSLPAGTISTTAAGSLVMAVVDNWDTSELPSVPSGQTTTINGRVAAILNPTDQDTYWLQVRTAPTAQPSSVTMNALSPNIRYHMITWEVLGSAS